jgi:hypothetical protein
MDKTTLVTTMPYSSAMASEERRHGKTVWVALRARGPEWALLTPDEAVQVATSWLERYSK